MSTGHKTAREIELWLQAQVAAYCGQQPSADAEFADLGLDSVEALSLLGDLESWLGLERGLTPTLVAEFPSIAALARHLAGESVAVSTPSKPALHTPQRHAFAEYVNPALGALLEQLRLDKEFVRGAGVELWDAQGRRYLDCVAAYGALPFGHNPPEIWAALEAARHCELPGFVQPSMLSAAGELARRLIELLGGHFRHVTFCNSGAEAVEAAIKLCRAATGRLGVLSTLGSFHGKTLGALSATGNHQYQDGFGAPAAGFHAIAFGDLDALQAAIRAQPDYYAAFIVEPIQGEGGIVEPPLGYLAAAKALCQQAGILLVADEVQTGLGRTGALFASTEVEPDVITLAKALGGGLFPIGACVTSQAAYVEHFALKHSSTFAGGTLACHAGLATLERLARNDFRLLQEVTTHGTRLKSALLDLQRRFPRVIAEVRGRGYLLGLRLAVDRHTWQRSVLGLAAEQGGLAPIIASYLLNVEGVRVAPTLNGADVIRIEPPLTATWEHCEELLQALERALPVIDSGDAGCVLGSIVSGARLRPRVLSRAIRTRALQRRDDGHFAFVLHPLDLRSYLDFDPSLASAGAAHAEAAIRVVHGLGKPAVVGETRVVGRSGRAAFGEFILVGQTAQELAALPFQEAVAQVRAAVELARERGAGIVGLGAFTSVVTQGGLAVADCGIAVTTGNTYTAVSAVDAVSAALRAVHGTSLAPVIAIVGAAGAIGRVSAILMADTAARLILIGNPGRAPEHNRRQLLRVAADLCRHVSVHSGAPGGTSVACRIAALASSLPSVVPSEEHWLGLAEQLEREGRLLLANGVDGVLPLAHAVIFATSATTALVKHYHLRRNAVVCDVSRPRNIDREVIGTRRADLLLMEGGLIEIPGHPDLGGCGAEEHLAYACMAETMLLALEQRYAHMSLGASIDVAGALQMRALAAHHGFEVMVPSTLALLPAARARAKLEACS